ncbi:unnamed protein product [Bemisia tabaci]|uniref:Uncharacterized protein n=1 Tax=Bemisia tabaci TaxID=7038 RepID=A0A9N9ZZ47_BEMTA|nr:unnamed protein product [Bemisia tabaci]
MNLRHGIKATFLLALMATDLQGAIGFLNVTMTWQPSNTLIKDFADLLSGFAGSLRGARSASPEVKTCTADVCIRKAAQMKLYMNESANPCDDFYEFACGNFERELAIPYGSSVYTLRDVADNKLNRDKMNVFELLCNFQYDDYGPPASRRPEPTFYTKMRNCFNSCRDERKINEQGVGPAMELIARLKGWPVLGNHSVISIPDIFKAMSAAGLSTQNLVFLTLNRVEGNVKQTVLRLQNPWCFGDDQDKVQKHMARHMQACSHNGTAPIPLAFAVEFAVYFGANRTDAEIQMSDVVRFECALFRIARLDGCKKPPTTKYVVHYRNLGLDIFPLEALFPPHLNLAPDEPILNTLPEYTRSLKHIMSEVDKRTFHNYMVYRSLRSLLLYLPEGARSLLKIVEPHYNIAKRIQFCAEKTGEIFLGGLNHIYYKMQTSARLKEEADDMADYIRRALHATIMKSPWLDEKTKSKAAAKVDSLNAMLIYQKEFLDESLIDSLYDEPYYDWDVDNFLLSYVRYQGSRERLFSRYNQTYDRFHWENKIFPIISNAHYRSATNTFAIYPPMALYPYSDPDLPKYVNYGSLGMLIGHEMGHAFSLKGRFHDEEGNKRDWWTQQSLANYKQITECLVRQYSNYSYQGLQMSGKASLNENIADNIGVKVSYDGLHAWSEGRPLEPSLPGFEKYTPKQMFWISFGNMWCSRYTRLGASQTGGHSVNPLRVNGPISNLHSFSQDFDCPLGSKMNPVSKCAGY